MEISRNLPLAKVKKQYIDIMGKIPRPQRENESSNAYKNVLVNAMLVQHATNLKYGAVSHPPTIGLNKPQVYVIANKVVKEKKHEKAIGEFVSKNTNKVVKEKKQEEPIGEFVTINQLENKNIDILRRVVTTLIPSKQRTKSILKERYNARRGVLNDLSVPNMIDLLRQNNITQISSTDAFRILLK